ncbi:MAG: hypothetical protein M0Z66_12320 [Thermaerobacter sp.]|nr:hypothetical protein [Thermaerobacter sp.]
MLSQTSGGADVRLPLSHVAFGLLASLTLPLVLLLSPQWLQHGLPGSTATLVATHLFTLGWTTATAMGALLMIVPVAGVAEVQGKGLGPIVPFATLPGILLLLLGFGTGSGSVLAVGGSLITLGVVAFVVIIWRTARAATVSSPTPAAAVVAAGFLLLTVLAGLAEALNLQYGYWAISMPRFWGLHVALGGFGWISLAILGVSYKLVQMFTLSHAQPRYATAVLVLWSVGVLWAAGAALYGTDPLAALAALPIITAYILFLSDMRRFLKARQRPIEPGIRQAILSWYVLGALLVLIPLDLLGVLAISPFALAFLFAFGWAGANLWGYLFKIAPFLVWFHSYAEDAATKKTPSLVAMAGPGRLRAGFYLLAAAVPLGFFGLAFDVFPVQLLGEVLLLGASLSFTLSGLSLAAHFFGIARR